MRRKYLFPSLILALLLSVLTIPARISHAANMVEVTVAVQRPATLNLSPEPGSTVDLAIMFLFIDVAPHAQSVQNVRLQTSYLHGLHVARINSVESEPDGSSLYLITFSVNPTTAVQLKWLSESRIPIRFALVEEF